MNTTPQTNLPPLPRLRAGHLLPESVEVTGLRATVHGLNIYEGISEEHGDLYILEGTEPLWEHRTEKSDLFPETLTSFTLKERGYLLARPPEGHPFLEGEFTCEEKPVLDAILSMIEACGYLESRDYDLEMLDFQTLFAHDNQWQFLFQPPMGTKVGAMETWMKRFVREFLCNRLAPGDTRDLERPLKRLCFTFETESILTDFLEERIDSNQLYQQLDASREESEPIWDIAGVTHPGLERERNEDAFAHMSYTCRTYRRQGDVNLLAVADGMGGHGMGDRASDLVLNIWFKEAMTQGRLAPFMTNPNLNHWLGDCLNRAQDQIVKLNRELAITGPPPGTTFVGGALINRRLFLLNCGDSRAYRLGSNGLERLTHDHSLIQKYIDQGDLTEAEAFGHESSNVITSFMGIEPKHFKYDQFIRRMGAGERLILCSDGLTDMVPEPEIEGIVQRSENAHEAVNLLVEAACKAGGRDNITVLAVFDQAPKDPAPKSEEEHQP